MDTDTQKRECYGKPQKIEGTRENGGRDWDDVSISQGTRRIATGQIFSLFIYLSCLYIDSSLEWPDNYRMPR